MLEILSFVALGTICIEESLPGGKKAKHDISISYTANLNDLMANPDYFEKFNNELRDYISGFRQSQTASIMLPPLAVKCGVV